MRVRDLTRTEKSLVAIARALVLVEIAQIDAFIATLGPRWRRLARRATPRRTTFPRATVRSSAFQRIRAEQYQDGTVPEPLNMQGWQLVDELNRAFNKAPWSGYTSGIHLVTPENVAYDGGDKNVFDPGNGYRDEYKKIWGVKEHHRAAGRAGGVPPGLESEPRCVGRDDFDFSAGKNFLFPGLDARALGAGN